MIFFSLFAELILLYVLYFILRPMINGAIYFPTSDAHIATMLRFAAVKPGEKIADLGSGDGRILIAFARAGAEAHGYEVNPLLVYRSRKAIRAAGLQGKAFVHWRSFWRADLSGYKTIAVYGISFIMEKLGKKLKKELPEGVKVISNMCPIPGWKEAKSEDKVYCYVIASSHLVPHQA